MSENLELDLDPKRILAALKDIGVETKNLAQKMEEALGKDAAKSIEKLEDTAEKGTTKITTFFRNLGTRVKEDLKTAFDMGMVLEGAKFAKDLAEGTKQVLEMERAFDKLNVRLGLSGNNLTKFKKDLGQAVAGTGQRLQDILPGVENAASKGGVKSPQQLTAIGEALGKAKAVTGEETGGLSDTIIEILKTQGKEVTAQGFKDTLDTLQATRVNGAFGTAGDAGTAVEGISPYAKQLGLSTRQLGGLAANASMSGGSGQQMLQNLLHNATGIGGAGVMNAGLGQHVFKGGNQGQAVGMDINALSKVNFAKMSPQVMEQITGMSGANGGDLKRFIDSMKNGGQNFSKVLSGMNENATQFTSATDNFASRLDQFKEKTKEAAREVGGSLSSFMNNVLHGNMHGAGTNLKDTGSALMENRHTIEGAMLATAAVGMMSGGSMGRLLGKVGGGAIRGQAAKAAGITPVYVTNASEIAEKGALTGGVGKMGKMKGVLGAAGGMLGAAALGYEIGDAIAQTELGKKIGEAIADIISPLFTSKEKNQANFELKKADEALKKNLSKHGVDTSTMQNHDQIASAFKAYIEKDKHKKVQFTNPSDLSGGRGKRAQ
jgi:hypothetical protein